MARTKKSSHIRRLILVTNREPFQMIATDNALPKWERAPGGLVSALEPAISRLGGTWISSAVPNMEFEGNDWPFDWRPIKHDPKLYHDFYSGFANGVLWPLFHSLINSSVTFERREWDAYEKINLHFAEECRRVVQPGDLVWVHDYQLCLVPEQLRAQAFPPDIRIGYFLHIPFPAYDLFRVLPFARQILLGLLGADVIAFQVQDYLEHFYDCVEEILDIRCDRNRGLIKHQGRKIKVRALPIGIDATGIHKIASQRGTAQKAKQLQAQTGEGVLIVGVDRLDYTKGLLRKLKAIELFFERYPKRRGQVSLLQLAVPTRTDIEEYQRLREDIEQAVGHINGLYARPGWTPVTYMCRSLPLKELVALYYAAQIALVTPLRDGMNLVAKEFVASHKNRSGVLILSELAGAAKELHDAVLVNPYDACAIAEAIEFGLNMDNAEQRRRMKAMNKQVSHYDVHGWIMSFLKEVAKA